MKYVVGYKLPYWHHVQVGIEAGSTRRALAKAKALFDADTLFADTSDMPLLRDEFEEDADAGVPLEFEIEQTLADGEDVPRPDASVRQMKSDALARKAAAALVAAYRNGEERGGSVDWSELDDAYHLALASQQPAGHAQATPGETA